MNILDLAYVSFDGNLINDGTKYIALPPALGTPTLATASPILTERADNFPVDGGAKLRGREWIVRIKFGATGDLNEITGWFDTSRTAIPRKLVVVDGSAVQYYIYARAVRFELSASPKTDEEGKLAIITMYAADPIWKRVTQSTNTWNITTTNQTRALTINGNKYARPVFEVTATTARGAGYVYRRFIAIANRRTRTYKTALNLPDANWDTAALVASTAVSNQINVGGGITAVATTWAIDTAVGGGLPAAGTFYVDSEQCSYTGKTAANIGTVVRGINGTTAAIHADNAVMRFSKMQADGDDVRVWDDVKGVEEFRWFGGGGINTTTTRVFSNVTLPPAITMTTAAAISNVGSVTSITVASTVANKNMLTLLKKQNYPYIAIDMGSGTMEIFKFTRASVSPQTYTIGGTTRAQKGTSNQSHAAGATIRHIYGYYLMYGNTDAVSPQTDDSFKPIINLTNSTNTSFDYDDFFDADNPNRSCMWTSAVVLNQGRKSEIYTATQDTFADVASVMGGAVKVYTSGGLVRAPNAELTWSLYHPAGITTLSWDGSKYRASTDYPTAGMEKSNDGITWSSIATEASPGSSATWTALAAHAGVALGATYLNIRAFIRGTLNKVANNMAAHEVSNVTATLDSNYTPLVYFVAEEANNFADFRITNNTTGQYLEVSQTIPLNETIYIDTENLEAYTSQGVPVQVRLDDETRTEWLPLGMNGDDRDESTKFTGAATIKYTETGVNAVTVVTKWYDRNL